MNYKKFLKYTIFGFFAAVFFTFVFFNYTVNIERTIYFKNNNNDTTSSNSKKIVYVGVISRYPPNVIYRGYQPILDYLSNNTDFTFQLKISENYNQVIDMLLNKEVEAAFVGSFVYVEAKEKYDIKPILKPLNENFMPFSRSVLFSVDSLVINNFSELKGKTVALPAKESYSSNWFTKMFLKKNNININDLKEIKYFPHHQSVINQVVLGYYNFGVTREYLLKNLIKNNVRIIAYSDPIPTSPIIALSYNNSSAINQLIDALLKINKNNPERKTITESWDNEFVFGFTKADDKDYNIIKDLLKN